MQRVVVVVQARMSSERLPGKVLLPLGGRPLLEQLLRRLAHCRSVDDVVVATSTAPSDDLLDQWLTENGVTMYRGALEDVAGRVAAAASLHSADLLVRVSGDSPLLDARIVDECVGAYVDQEPDLVSNVFPRTFPHGQSVEVLRPSLLEAVSSRQDRDQREHVTKFFYDHSEEYKIVNVCSSQPAPDARLVVDTLEDYQRLAALFDALDPGPTTRHLSLLEWLRERDEKGEGDL